MIYVLGGGGGKAFAAIHVTYPAGSTCRCTKGAKVLKAKGTGGVFNFLVPEAGTWRVSCTDGTSEAYTDVVISAQDANKYKSTDLSYVRYLLRNGTLQNGVSFTGNSYATYTAGSGISCQTEAATNAGAFSLTPSIALDDYSTLVFELTPIRTDNSSSSFHSNTKFWAGLRSVQTANNTFTSSVAKKEGVNCFQYGVAGQILSLDISDISGDFYIGAYSDYSNGSLWTNIWLE